MKSQPEPRFRIPRSPTFRAALKVATGSTVGQAITLAVVPLLSRLYSPQEFGIFAVVLALTVVLAAVAPLRFDAAVALPTARTDGVSILWIALASCVVTLLPLTVLTSVYQEHIATVVGLAGGLAPYLWLAPLNAMLLATFQVLNQLAIRDKRYSATARRPFYAAAVTGLAQVALAGPLDGPSGLLAGYSLGLLAGALSLLPGSKINQFGREWRGLASRYRRFPLILAPSALLNALSLQLPVILIASLFSQAESGLFGMTQRAVGLPIVVIATAVGQVYLGEMSELIRNRRPNALRLFDRASRSLTMVGILLFAFLLVGGPTVFAWVLGPEWETSGRYAQILAPAIAAQMLTSPLASTLIVLERQLTLVALDLVRVGGTTGALAIAAMAGSTSEVAVAAYSVASAVTYLLYWHMSRRALGASAQQGGIHFFSKGRHGARS